MQFIFALVFFLLGLGANAVTFSDIVGSLPDGGYTADMTTYRNGVLHIADLDGNPVKGSPFVIDPIPPNVAIHGTQTKDSWGVSFLLCPNSSSPCTMSSQFQLLFLFFTSPQPLSFILTMTC